MADLLKEVSLYLTENKFNCILDISNNCIKVKYPVTEADYNLELRLPKSFPYEFPSISVSEEFKKNIRIAAHIYVGNTLCLEFKGKEEINPTKYKEVAKYALEKAIRIIDKAIAGDLEDEKLEEIDNYWDLCNKKNIRITSYSIYNKLSKDHKVSFGTYCKVNTNMYIAKEKETTYWEGFRQIVPDIDKQKKNQCIFISVDSKKELYELRKFDKLLSYLYRAKNRKITDYLNQHRKEGVIVLVDTNENNKQYAVFYAFEKYNKVHLKKSIQDILPLRAENYLSINIVPILLDQVSLFNRSANGYEDIDINHVCIVGCGSIGCVLANCYANLGVEEITLIDNDTFTEKNLLRHVGNISNINESKTKVVENYLLANYPYLKVNTITKSVFEVGDELKGKQFDLLLIATGELRSEFFCLDEYLKNNYAKKALIFWLDPYAIAGNVIVFDKRTWNKSDYDLLFSNINYISAVENRGEFYKKEAGCSSAYIPYSAMDVQIFLNEFVKKSAYSKYDSYTYTKLLNIKFARKNRKIKLNKRYSVKKDGDIIIGQIND